LLIILGIILLVFGPRRLGTIGKDLGEAIKGFRSAMQEDSTLSSLSKETSSSDSSEHRSKELPRNKAST
jgi:sec-independent protein translocase protein TatA